jgi:hypothetical protein
MIRWFTEKEVRRMIAEAVAEAVAPLKARITELEAEVARLKQDFSTFSKPLKHYLGEAFGGIVGCDYFSAYRKFLRETDVGLQLCWAHLIRDMKYLTTLLNRAT